MHAVQIVFPLQPDASDLRRTVAEEIKTVKSREARVFRTFVVTRDDGRHYTLTTTSKDICLAIGEFSMFGQCNFCKFLDEEIAKSEDAEVLLTGMTSYKGVLVTRAMLSGSFTSYQLAPAN